MKKQNVIISTMIIISILSSCKQVETVSPRKEFYLTIEQPDKDKNIDIVVSAGSSQKLKTKSENVLYKILLFKVRGDYSDLFGQKFNNHDGLDASRISIY